VVEASLGPESIWGFRPNIFPEGLVVLLPKGATKGKHFFQGKGLPGSWGEWVPEWR